MKQLLDCRFLQLKKFRIHKGYQETNALLYIESGGFEYTMGGKREQAGPHQLVNFPEKVYFERRMKQPTAFYYVRYASVGEELPIGIVPIKNTGRLLSTLQYLLQLNNIGGEQPLKDALLEDIFRQQRAESLLLPSPPDPELARLTAFFEENLHRKISLREAADAACLSPNGLIHRCKRQLGQTPMEYLCHLRLERAESLLCETNESIAGIARLCGFESPYYFSNVFKRYRGIAPGQYRKRRSL